MKEEELSKLVNKLNHDCKIDGILIQLPLPNHMDAKCILQKVIVEKDVDGFHPYNVSSCCDHFTVVRNVLMNNIYTHTF